MENQPRTVETCNHTWLTGSRVFHLSLCDVWGLGWNLIVDDGKWFPTSRVEITQLRKFLKWGWLRTSRKNSGSWFAMNIITCNHDGSFASLKKTSRLLIIDTSGWFCGFISFDHRCLNMTNYLLATSINMQEPKSLQDKCQETSINNGK